MTYTEIKRRLVKCEKLLEKTKEQNLTNASPALRQKVQLELKQLHESISKYKSMLLKEEKTYILTPKSGKPSAASLGDDEVEALKDADDIQAIKSADGEEIKEQEGVEFSLEETKAIAKKVGKAVAVALKAVGDSVTTMKAHRIEPNSFDVHVEYKNGRDDEFSFYITDDTLHLVDFSFDKELVDVGVKPSGEAIVQVDHLANELQKHFKSLSEDVNEVSYSHYTTPKHFDICPGAEALRDEIIKGGKSAEELGEWTFLHDELFKLEKAVIKANKADERHIKVAKQFKSQIINLSRDLGIEANKIGYLSGHVKKIEDIASKTDGKGDNVTLRSKDIYEGEGDDHHYLKVSRRDYKKTMSILDNNVDPTYVKTEVVDDDGAGNVIIYFIFRHEYGFDDMYDDPEGKENPELYQEPDEDPSGFMYDVVMDLQAQGIEVVDHSAELDEATDINDPVLMRMRVAKKRNADLKKVDQMHARDRKDQRINGKKRLLIKQLKDKRAEIEREMENDPEIEPTGGPVADRYGDMLNKIDNAIEKAAGRIKPLDYDTAVGKVNENEPTVFDDESFDALRDIILKYVEDPDDAERAVQQVDDQGLDSLSPELIANLERDPEFEAWYDKLHNGPSADTDYMQRRRADNDYMEEDTDIGHQDDEPSMLKASAFETAEYAAKLVKKLAQYDKHDGEVDFPNWWQKKLILARDYMSAAFHYLDSQEKQPAIDQLALESKVNERLRFLSPEKQKANDAKFEKRMALLKALEKGIELHKAGKISDKELHNLKLKAGTISADSKASLEEGTELYDRNGIHIKRFSGGQRGVMVQITIGDKYIVVPADEYPFLVRAMQSVQGDLKDLTRQYPRKKNMDEASVAKIQKAHGQVVAKMKELAKQYKAGDTSVVAQLKDLTAKKKQLEKHLDAAVAGIGKNQGLTELSTDQRNDLVELQNILDDVNAKGEEAREIIRQSFPRMLSKADAYGAFDFGSSANRYDTTLESIIEEIEEYYDEEEDDMEEEYKGKHQGSNYKWPMSQATKDRKEADKVSQSQSSSLIGRLGDRSIKEEMDSSRLFDYFNSKGYDITERRPDGYPPKEGVVGYQVSRGSDRSPQSVIFQYNTNNNEFTISQMSGYRIDQKEAIKAGMRRQGRSFTAGQDSYMTDGNYNPVGISPEGLKDIVDHVMSGLDREAKAQGDFYKDRGHTSGTIDEKTVSENIDIKKASTDKLEKLLKQSEDEKVSPAFASQLKLIRKELQNRKKNLQEGATCCGRCGRVHVKGSGCKRPYLKGKDHCRNK